MTDETTTLHRPNPEDPEDRYLALNTALVKIFNRPRRLPHRTGPATPTMIDP